MAIAPLPGTIPSLGGSIGSIGGAPADAAGFASALGEGIQQISGLEHAANTAIQDVASGGETSVAELMATTSKAQLGVEMLAQVRDRAVEAYQEIMRMQV